MIMNIPEESVSSQKSENILETGHFSSPIGEIFVAFGKKGLKGLCVGAGKAEFIAGLKTKHRVVEKKDGFARLFKLLDSYFKGKKVLFDMDIDPEGTEFEIKVWRALLRIPYGETRTYGDVAAEIGVKGGARAVGGACAKNPLPIIVPCHRVVGASGLGGYSAGGAGTKEMLLRLEGALASTPCGAVK